MAALVKRHWRTAWWEFLELEQYNVNEWLAQFYISDSSKRKQKVWIPHLFPPLLGRRSAWCINQLQHNKFYSYPLQDVVIRVSDRTLVMWLTSFRSFNMCCQSLLLLAPRFGTCQISVHQTLAIGANTREPAGGTSCKDRAGPEVRRW